MLTNNSSNHDGECARAAKARAEIVPVQYANNVRGLDQTYDGVEASAVRSGHVPDGPVLAALRQYPAVRGLVFGPYSDASPEVHEYARHIATVGASRDWRAIGATDVAEAFSVILQHIYRDKGSEAARASARSENPVFAALKGA